MKLRQSYANCDYLWLGSKIAAGLFFKGGPRSWISLFAKCFYLHDVLNGRINEICGLDFKLSDFPPR